MENNPDANKLFLPRPDTAGPGRPEVNGGVGGKILSNQRFYKLSLRMRILTIQC